MTRWTAARWIAQFEAAGGLLSLAQTKAGTVELFAGWRAAGNPLERQLAARRMIEELFAHPRRWRAVTIATARRHIALAFGRRA